MPHVIVKLWPGRSEEQKMKLTEKIVQAVTDELNAEETSVSVSFEEVAKERWTQDVYIPDIAEKESMLYKKPGYKPSI
ncbi:MAG: 4-oxalocrotonate tautomerase [Ruminiclostridium sp.]|nr:4-oxalocrotonate tautomerase [Ruminiclostridium sp.]